MVRTAEVGFRTLLTVLAAAITLTQILVSRHIWDPGVVGQAALVVALCVLTILDTIVSSIKQRRAKKNEGRKDRISKALIAALSSIAQKNDHQMALLGASAWALTKIWRFEISVRPVRRVEVLKRIAKFRPSEAHQPSPVVWTQGKGCIGSAWKTKREVHKDWRPIAAKHGGKDPVTPEKFANLPPGTTGGLTYEEFVAIVDKYAEVLALPVMSETGARVVGVISIDRPMADGDDKPPILDNRAARVAVTGAALTIRDDI